jgi:hypothetical protein
MVPGRVQTASGVEFGIGSASEATPTAKTSPILESKLVQNWSGSDQKSKKFDSETDFEFDVVFSKIFDQIWLNFDAKINKIRVKF